MNANVRQKFEINVMKKIKKQKTSQEDCHI